MPFIYQLLNRNAACCSTLKGWIKEQISLFPKNCCNIDYRKLVYNNEFYVTEFNKYFHKEMENFFLNATSSKKSKHRKADSPFLNLRHLLCIRMAISLLYLAMNPKAVFMQTLVGLIAYAYVTLHEKRYHLALKIIFEFIVPCSKHSNTGLTGEGFTPLRASVALLQSSKGRGHSN